MVPGLSTPLTFLKICLATTCFVALMRTAAVLMVLDSVGSSVLRLVASFTTMSAEMETLWKRTSIFGICCPKAVPTLVVTCSCKASAPCAMSASALSYPMVVASSRVFVRSVELVEASIVWPSPRQSLDFDYSVRWKFESEADMTERRLKVGIYGGSRGSVSTFLCLRCAPVSTCF
ncbi:hypothetical protein PHYPSEUDO_005934 [Phytophthora pseudosyringae]|uniref:Uncharacterized protein n=1 Tax=Phytophthora pseudosyringae TaxID=221518 RepID=A0A8T1VKC0_9STRA|nr:hypothetical protein PHYPSEUDO_005934 [Phytophthora pseudosyringae]